MMEKIDISKYSYEIRQIGTSSIVPHTESLLYELAEKLNEVIDHLNKKEGEK